MKEKGLTEKEAKDALEKYGKNEIHDLNKTSALKIFLRQIKSNFIIYLLAFATALSFFVGKNLTGFVILGVIVVIVITGFVQEYRAEKAIASLKKMITPVSVVIRNGKEIEMPSESIVPGDILILRSGEKIPADCIILEQRELQVNESILTGESREINKKETKYLEKFGEENKVFMGTFIVNGKCVAKVIHTGMNTRFGKISGMISEAEKELPLQKKVNKIAKYMAILGTTFAILSGIIMILHSKPFDNTILIEALIIVIAIAVSSFPEGFPVVLITALAHGTYKMAKRNAIVNRMSIIETLGETTVICSDKTGTITKGEMTVKKIFFDGKMAEVTGTGYGSEGEFLIDGKKIDVEKEKVLFKLIKTGVLCNDANIERGEEKNYKIIGTPTEASLLIMAAKSGCNKNSFEFSVEEEIPFSSEKKMMSVLCREKRELNIYSKGALEIILKKCKFIQKESGIFTLTEKERNRILSLNKEITTKSYRTLALAYRKTETKNKEFLEKELIFLGLVVIEDPPREEVKEAIQTCITAGIKVKMITGDNKETAISVAKQIGLETKKILEGFEIDNLTEEELTKIVSEVTIFARVRPEHKLRIVRALKNNGEIVTMTGDGVNDAPALKESQIGVAMGKNGTDVSRAVADLTLKDDNFATIVEAIKEGRTIFSNIQKFSTYQISINFSQVALIFLAILINLPLPLIAIQILFMNLFSDEIIAITLAFSNHSKDIMTSSPKKNRQIISKPLLGMLSVAGIFMALVALFVFRQSISDGNSIEEARTITFASMVIFGVANAFNFRSFRKRVLTRSPFANTTLFVGAIISILGTLLIIYSPLRKFFETLPLQLTDWILPLTAAIILIGIFDVIKTLNKNSKFFDFQDI